MSLASNERPRGAGLGGDARSRRGDPDDQPESAGPAGLRAGGRTNLGRAVIRLIAALGLFVRFVRAILLSGLQTVQ